MSCAEPVTTDSGLQYEDIVPGTGRLAEPGMKLLVHYLGQLEDGTVFDASRECGEPYEFVLGAGSVIEGWDEGLPGMRVGGKRRLTVPGELAYGAHRAGTLIPPGAVLVFEIELLDAE